MQAAIESSPSTTATAGVQCFPLNIYPVVTIFAAKERVGPSQGLETTSHDCELSP